MITYQHFNFMNRSRKVNKRSMCINLAQIKIETIKEYNEEFDITDIFNKLKKFKSPFKPGRWWKLARE